MLYSTKDNKFVIWSPVVQVKSGRLNIEKGTKFDFSCNQYKILSVATCFFFHVKKSIVIYLWAKAGNKEIDGPNNESL